MPFVIATQIKTPVISGGSPNPAGQAVAWYFCGLGKWTRDIGKAKRFNDDDAATQFVLLKDTLPNQKFTFIVVDQLPIAAELAAMDPSEIGRLAKLSAEYRALLATGYVFTDLPAPHEPRIYKIGQKQCDCKGCVDRLVNLFPGLE
jgi:ATP:corrinoid adenosyltransferase